MLCLQSLNRDEYLHATSLISDPESQRFLTQALEWWDRHISWRHHQCLALCDRDHHIVCYLFYKIDRYHEYLTIYNLFTPCDERRKGYAKYMLTYLFDYAITYHVKRFTLSSISRSLDFYSSLGFCYWGINACGDYHCDLPIPHDGLQGLDAMVKNSTAKELLGNKKEAIFKKVHHPLHTFSSRQQQCHHDDIVKLANRWYYQILCRMVESEQL